MGEAAVARENREDFVARALVHRGSMVLAAIAIVVSFVLPVEGLGVDLCMVHAVLELPCPGCGLTRSLTSVAHGQLGHAFALHPFGPAIWALAAVLAIGNVVGEERREVVRRWLRRHHVAARRGYLAFVYAFVAFGVARLAVSAAQSLAL